MKFELGKYYKIVSEEVVKPHLHAHKRFKVGDVFFIDGEDLKINSFGNITSSVLEDYGSYFTDLSLQSKYIIEVPKPKQDIKLMTLEEIKNSNEVFVVESEIGTSSILYKGKLASIAMASVCEVDLKEINAYKIYKFDDYPEGNHVYDKNSKQSKLEELKEQVRKLEKEIEDEQ